MGYVGINYGCADANRADVRGMKNVVATVEGWRRRGARRCAAVRGGGGGACVNATDCELHRKSIHCHLHAVQILYRAL